MRRMLPLILTLLLAGCVASAPAIRPVELRQHLLRAQRSQDRRRRVACVPFGNSRVRFGPAPRRLEVLVDRTTGVLLSIKEQ